MTNPTNSVRDPATVPADYEVALVRDLAGNLYIATPHTADHAWLATPAVRRGATYQPKPGAAPRLLRKADCTKLAIFPEASAAARAALQARQPFGGEAA